MADYEKVSTRIVFSANSDYSNPKQDTKLRTVVSTPSYVKHVEMLIGTAATTLIAAGEWTTVDSLYVENLGSGELVTVGYTDTAADAQTIDVLAGDPFLTCDVDPSVAVTLTAAGQSAIECLIYVSGS